MVFISAPYKRGYKHTGGKGKEGTVRCGYCGKTVPRWKSFTSFRGFRITDPVLRKSIDSRQSSFFQTKIYACPGCARHRGIIKIGKSRKSR